MGRKFIKKKTKDKRAKMDQLKGSKGKKGKGRANQTKKKKNWKNEKNAENKNKRKGPSEFRKTINEINKMLNPNSLADQIKKRRLAKQKMPMNMLKGVRNKRIKNYKAQVESKRQQGILFDSMSKNFDVDFYHLKKQRKKFAHLLTEEKSYKYAGVVQQEQRRRKGRYEEKSGIMTFSAKDIKAIEG